MSQPIIEVRNLSKRYQLGSIGATSIREEASRLWDRMRGVPHPDAKEFWALRDVSFDVQPGEVVGVIGRNGAGKSTLLKILSRITEPTSGTAKLRGRVASLLEVGTGFHPELTGRENVFLNGAILGMTRAEVRRKFDEIVAFAEVDQFIDTPVKRYSSGMYVRLAFAVAAHLEPEILIIDEVLAVGDAHFQLKCIGKMDDVARNGKTVIFVSHIMGTVAKLCTRCVLLAHGKIVGLGPTADIVARYLSLGDAPDEQGSALNLKAPAHPFTLRSVVVFNAASQPATLLSNAEQFCIRLTYELAAPIRSLRIGFRLHAHDGSVVLSTTDCDRLGGKFHDRPAGVFTSEVEFPAHFLNKGRYFLWVGVDVPMVAAVLSHDRAASFSIESIGGLTADVNDNRLGVVAPLLPWTNSPSLSAR
jgi:lipopolysaccharide transport system ATP-binding protein